MRSEAAFRALLLVYPKTFRSEFGEDMVQVFTDQRRHRGRSGLAIWAQAVPDLFFSGMYERKESVMSKKTYALGGAVLLTGLIYAAVLVGVGGSPSRALLVLGIVYAIALALFGISALVGRKVDASTEKKMSIRRNWWTPVPVLFAFGYMVVGVRPMVENPSAKELIPVAVSMAFAGLAIFGLIARYRRNDNLGNWAILISCLPAFPVFWFPPVPILGLIGVIGTLSEVFASRRQRRPQEA